MPHANLPDPKHSQEIGDAQEPEQFQDEPNSGADDGFLTEIDGYEELPSQIERPVIPPADYLVECSRAEVKPTKAGNMNQIILQLKVLSGQHAGTILFDRINMLRLPDHPGSSLPDNLRLAINIGNVRRKAFETATGGARARHVGEYVGRICMARVGVREAKGKYGESNEIKNYFAANKPNGPAGQPSSSLTQIREIPPERSVRPAASSVVLERAPSPGWKPGRK